VTLPDVIAVDLEKLPMASVDICVCSYERASLRDTILSIGRQSHVGDVKLRLIVADNASEPWARSLAAEAAGEAGLKLTYLHAPANNISVARNACLAAATADGVAFLDDDESASEGWLAALLGEARHGGWAAVLGPVRARYSCDVPRWIAAADVHSTRPVWVRREIRSGYTGNVLLRRAFLQRSGLEFRLEYGRTGGEDAAFFHDLRDAGGSIGFAAAALVEEDIPPQRASLKWMVSRAFRSGQSHGSSLLRGRGAWRAAEILQATAKAAACAVGAVLAAAWPPQALRLCLRSALHWGVAVRLAGFKEIRQY
jgi:succinoglycan biosynthesis protein ExoM